jgi:hypothetical protein
MTRWPAAAVEVRCLLNDKAAMFLGGLATAEQEGLKSDLPFPKERCVSIVVPYPPMHPHGDRGRSHPPAMKSNQMFRKLEGFFKS